MDGTTRAIIDFASSLTFENLPTAARTATKVRVLDTYACAWGGIDADTVAAAKRAFLAGQPGGPAHLITGETAPVETAAFINSLMGRYLDFNDAHAVAYGHPSDMILPLFNVAEETGASGADALLAIAAAYQVACSITLAGGVHYARWETAFGQGVGTAVGAAMLLGLGPDSIADAVGISVACTSPLNIRKTGTRLSMWKGCAGPQASKMGIEAAWLARAGMAGPDEAFEGTRGVWEKVTGEFSLEKYLNSIDRWQIEETTIKLYPVSGRTLAPVETTIGMREEIGDVSQIESIGIQTYNYCYEFEQKDHGSLTADAWNPQTREMADHSLRWLMAVSLLDGTVTPDSFSPEGLSRTDVRGLVESMTITENEEFTARWPAEWINEITVTMRDGRTLQRRNDWPTGNPKRPATPEALQGKADALIGPHLGLDQTRELSKRIASLENWDRAAALFDYVAETRQ